MVFITKVFFGSSRKKATKYLQHGFMDSLRIHVKAGSGGNGLPKYGGVGGQGGNVSLIAKDNFSLENVYRTNKTKRYGARHGMDSSRNFILGVPGENIKVEVPVGITVFTDEGCKLGELNEEGEELIVAKGGIGGHKNNGFLGTFGQNHSVTLDLKLISDIGLVGFPNAGKSTLLKAVSQAKPKIASYPFTTIRPNIGIMVYKDLRQISMADLPGLIEGAHANQGMGHKFLKHVERTKIMLLVVDINGFQMSPLHKSRSCLDTIVLLNKELELYNPTLLDKPSMIVINKMDTEGAWEHYKEIKNKILNIGDHFTNYSENMRPERALHFQNILPISAREGGEATDNVKEKLRIMLDILFDENRDENAGLLHNITESQKEKGPTLT